MQRVGTFSRPLLCFLLLIVDMSKSLRVLTANGFALRPRNWLNIKMTRSGQDLPVRQSQALIPRWLCNPNLSQDVSRERGSLNDTLDWEPLSTPKLLQFGDPVTIRNHSFIHVGSASEGILPDPFHDWLDLPPDLLVRKSYEELYRLIVDAVIMENGVAKGGGVVTGVPGVGKSYFGIYFLFRFLTDPKFVDKRITFEYERGSYMHFIPSTEPGRYECFLVKLS